MGACEKCWRDAHNRFAANPTKGQADYYQELIRERDAAGKTCTPQEQAGDFWDEKQQCDIRNARRDGSHG